MNEFSNHHSHTDKVPVAIQEERTFEYTGQTGLSVIGNITGKKYRFSFHGDRQLIDHRDAGGMMAVPGLRAV